MNVRSVVLAIVAVGMAAVLAGCSDNTQGSSGTLKLTEPGGNSGSFGVIGKATQNATPAGSGIAFSSALEDSSGTEVGEIDAFCIATAPSGTEKIHGTCSATTIVPGGSFALNVGGKAIGGDVSGAIVGGTGKYEGAVGTFTSKPTGGENGPSDLTFEYTLP